MINVSGNKWIPSDGYNYLTDGVTWTDSIYLGRGDSIDRWHDTNEEPHDPEPDPTPEEALSILLGGVEE